MCPLGAGEEAWAWLFQELVNPLTGLKKECGLHPPQSWKEDVGLTTPGTVEEAWASPLSWSERGGVIWKGGVGLAPF